MTRMTIDPALRTKLLDLSRPLELCDESGRVLARLVPSFDPELYEDLEPRISRDERQRRRQQKGQTYTTAEVQARLESL